MNKIEQILKTLGLKTHEFEAIKAQMAVSMKTCLSAAFTLRRFDRLPAHRVAEAQRVIARNAFQAWSFGLKQAHTRALRSGSGSDLYLEKAMNAVDRGYRHFLLGHPDPEVRTIASLLPESNFSTQVAMIEALVEMMNDSDEFDEFLVGDVTLWGDVKFSMRRWSDK